MPSLREIKGHIQSVDSIAKVTRAMEVVAAAKAHRLEARMRSTRPFSDRSWQVLNHLAAASESAIQDEITFCGYPGVEHIGLVLFTSNRGMVGAYDHTVTMTALRYLQSRRAEGELITVGKVGREMMLHYEQHIHADFSSLEDSASLDDLTAISRVLLDGFREKHFEQVTLVHSQHRPGARLQPAVRQLLPICPEITEPREYIYEPSPDQLLAALLPRVIRFQVYEAFLEARASENTARMVAMHSATSNAGDLTESLTLSYNKARQQAITNELLDILGGTVNLDREV
jgi:F-type H+-transporting ATPase subunit gamma